MPRKNNNTPEVRLMQRENQRRSRMRQKELLDEMRQRIERYERDGIQATASMQASARLVDAENTALRSLLAAKGVTPDEIHNHLMLNGIIRPSTPAPMIQSAPKLQVLPEDQGTDVVCGSVETGRSSQLDDNGVAEGRQMDQAGTRMSCDVAASIVADVAGHDDRGYARSALGCTTSDCSVKTSRVFDIIDRVTRYQNNRRLTNCPRCLIAIVSM